MKVIIAGGRDFNDYETLKKVCDFMLQNQSKIEVISGTAKGADSLGERYAIEKEYTTKQFPVEWDKYDRAAGYKRNKEMAEYADALIAFWDNKSKGTGYMIDLAKENNLKVKVYNY